MVKAKTSWQVQKYYQRRYQKEKLAAMRPYEAYLILLEYLKPKEGKKLLDVGCGTGYFLKAAAEKGLQTYGIDFSGEAVKIAQEISPQSKIFLARAEKLPFKNNFFDYLVCLGSLQYFPQMGKAIAEMKRVAKENALFCFMVPNADFLVWKLKGKNQDILWGVEGNIKNLAGWRKFWQTQGLKVRATYKDNWLTEKRGKLFKVLWQWLPLKYTYQFIFLLSKLC